MVNEVSPDQLLAQLHDANHTIEELKECVIERDEKIARQAAQIAWLEKNLFGAKSEKNVVPPPPAAPQLDVFGEQGEATDAEIKEESKEPEKVRTRKSRPRQPLPKNLLRKQVVHDIPEEEKTCACCGKAMCRIGEDVTEKLEVIPMQLYVEEHVRPRYACGSCKDAVAQAPLPVFPIQRAAAGASVLAYLMLSKYADHLPLCRMERIFARHGIDLPRSKTCNWMMQLAELMRPLTDLMCRRIIERSHSVGADETTIKMLDPGGGKNKTKTCFLWEYRGDDLAPYTVFDFQESRNSDGPKEMLRDYKGFLQSDAYSVYSSLVEKENLKFKQVGCWAHARRKFIAALEGGDKRAEEAIAIIRELYGIEKKAREKEFDHEALRKLRQEESVPVLERLREWMNAQLAALPKSPLGIAIGYALDNWKELTIYATDGRLPIDNNAVERAIRPVAVGRKNWLFAGSQRGGGAAATFFSLIDSARRAGVNLWHYFTDLLKRLPSHPISKLEELLPDRWQPQRD